MYNSVVLKLMQLKLQSRGTTRVVAESGVFLFIMIIILIGNSLTVYIVLSRRRMRTVPNLFIVSLAISDIAIGLLAMPMSLTVLASSYWPFGDDACQYNGFIDVTMAAASTQTLAWTSVNRYFRVVRPNKYRTYFTMRSTITCIISTWVLAALAVTPYLSAGNRMVFHPGKLFCYLDMNSAWFTAFLVTLYVGIPAIVIMFCYFRVFQVVRRHNKQFMNSRVNQNHLSVEEIKITRTLFIVVLVYMLCWTPILIMDLVDTFRGYWSLSREAYTCYTFLAVVSSATNPIIYGFMNPVFRNKYVKIICCKKETRENSGPRKINDKSVNGVLNATKIEAIP